MFLLKQFVAICLSLMPTTRRLAEEVVALVEIARDEDAVHFCEVDLAIHYLLQYCKLIDCFFLSEVLMRLINYGKKEFKNSGIQVEALDVFGWDEYNFQKQIHHKLLLQSHRQSQ